jgi:RNA polymerase sigma-70 factor (subfamily 1)
MSVLNPKRDLRTREPGSAALAAPDGAQFVQHLRRARGGSRSALGWLLDTYRQYLLAIAHQNLDPELRAKVATSDLVQQTVMEALAHFGAFDGQGPAAWAAWLCRILEHNLADARRQYRATQKRQLAREVALADAPLAALAEVLASDADSPSAAAIAREQEAALERGLAALGKADRQVVQWRSFERLSFDEVGRQLGCSAEAARKRWARAVEALGQSLESPDESR